MIAPRRPGDGESTSQTRHTVNRSHHGRVVCPYHDDVVMVVCDGAGNGPSLEADPGDQPEPHPSTGGVPFDHGDLEEVT